MTDMAPPAKVQVRWFMENDSCWEPFSPEDSARLEETYDVWRDQIKKRRQGRGETKENDKTARKETVEKADTTGKHDSGDQHDLHQHDLHQHDLHQHDLHQHDMDGEPEVESSPPKTMISDLRDVLPPQSDDEDGGESDGLGNEIPHVLVRGGRFVVSIWSEVILPLYWESPPRRVCRGTWFWMDDRGGLSPYTEDIAAYLEIAYREGQWNKHLMLPDEEHYVVLRSDIKGVYYEARQYRLGVDYHANRMHMRPRIVTRGYKWEDPDVEFDTIDNLVPDHLVLVVHGIGSKHDLKFRNIIECVGDLRTTAHQFLQSHFSEGSRVEFLPVEWHESLHEGEGVDDQVAAITLDGIPKLRQFANDTIIDVLFFMSPKYAQAIVLEVTTKLNRIYAAFCANNPDFCGKVSILGHSLGSVISFDILAHQNGATLSGTGGESIYFSPLDFEVENLFAVGSPLGLFLTARQQKLSDSFELPNSCNVYNLFHPYDCIAYRLEPLISPQWTEVPPDVVPHHKGRKRLHLELKEMGNELKKGIVGAFTTIGSKMGLFGSPTESATAESDSNAGASEGVGEVEAQDGPGSLCGGARVDYVLQAKLMENMNEYLFSISSHLCYWTSFDTALFILTKVGIPTNGEDDGVDESDPEPSAAEEEGEVGRDVEKETCES